MRQPQYPQPRGAQPQGVRGSNPVDTDVTFMREEYVTGQPNSRAGPQSSKTGMKECILCNTSLIHLDEDGIGEDEST